MGKPLHGSDCLKYTFFDGKNVVSHAFFIHETCPDVINGSNFFFFLVRIIYGVHSEYHAETIERLDIKWEGKESKGKTEG